MSASNLEEEVAPLLKLLRTPAFRFVLVCHNHYSLVEELIVRLSTAFPDRPQARLSADTTDFETFSKTYEALDSGFLFLERFEELVRNRSEASLSAEERDRIRDLTIGLNLKRDRWAKKPVALVVFLSIATTEGELPARSLMQKLPDLWSLRSLIVSLEMEVRESVVPEWPKPKWGAATVENREEKEKELLRLRHRLQEIPESEEDYRINTASEIQRLALELADLEAAVEAHRVFEAAVSAYPESKEMLADLALSCGIVGDLYQDLEDLSQALSFFEKERHILEQLIQAHPLDELLKQELGRSYQNLGEVWQDRGQLSEALVYFEMAVDVFTSLLKANSGIKELLFDLAYSYEQLGELHQLVGDLNQAIVVLGRARDLLDQLALANPENESLKSRLALVYVQLGDVTKDLGLLPQALRNFEKAREVLELLHSIKPIHFGYINSLAHSYFNLADVYRSIGDLTKAQVFLENVIFLFERISDNKYFANQLVFYYWELANLLEKVGNSPGAKSNYEKALFVHESLGENAEHIEDKKWLAELKRRIAALG